MTRARIRLLLLFVLLLLSGAAVLVLAPASPEAAPRAPADDSAPSAAVDAPPPGSDPLPVAARPARLSGRVADAVTGDGVAGVRVLLRRSLGPVETVARSGPDGRFASGDLAPGEATLLAWDERWLPAEVVALRRPPSVVLAPGETQSVELLVLRAAAVEGRVLDAAGKPLPGAEVSTEWHRTEGLLGMFVRTDGAGRFRLGGMVPGLAVGLTVRHERRVPAAVGPVYPTAPSPPEVEVFLAEGRTVEVLVRDADSGEPLPGAEVSTRRRLSGGRWTWRQGLSVVTGSDGRARIGPVSTRGFALVASRSGYRSTPEPVPIPDDPGENPIVLGLHPSPPPPEPKVRARLVDPSGRPVSVAGIACWSDLGRVNEALCGLRVGEGGAVLGDWLLDDGVLEVYGARDADGARLGGVFFEKPREEEPPPLVRLPPAGEVSGRVEDPAGRPVGGLRVLVERPSVEVVGFVLNEERPVHGEARTDADGRFRVVGLGEGDHTLVVRPGPGYALPNPRQGRRRPGPTPEGRRRDPHLPRPRRAARARRLGDRVAARAGRARGTAGGRSPGRPRRERRRRDRAARGLGPRPPREPPPASLRDGEGPPPAGARGGPLVPPRRDDPAPPGLGGGPVAPRPRRVKKPLRDRHACRPGYAIRRSGG